nr:unnamed protein product [Digitaria exilis]
MAAARRLFSFHLALQPRAPARPLAAASVGVATPHRRGKHDAVACKATGKAKPKSKAKAGSNNKGGERRPLEEHLKRRTRSAAAFDAGLYGRHGHAHHVPVLLGEVLAAFRRPRPLRSFVDCTLGAAGHSLAMMEAHPEMELYVGMDVDPTALEIGRGHIEAFLAGREANRGEDSSLQGTLRAYTHVKNFKYIKQVLGSVDESLAVGSSGVDGILIDLGMSSMQATLRAEDILNSWPELEVGRVLRDYGEESNWRFLQKQIIKAREMGGLHSTGDLVKLIQRKCNISKAL